MEPHPGPDAAAANWRSVAACQSADPDLFFPVSASGRSLEQLAQAKAVCAGCGVRPQCLAFALRTRQANGVWGGTSEAERAAIRRKLISAEQTSIESGDGAEPVRARSRAAG